VTKEAIEDFMESLEEALSQPNDALMTVVQRLKSQGLKTGLLTNNWASPGGRSLLLKVSHGLKTGLLTINWASPGGRSLLLKVSHGLKTGLLTNNRASPGSSLGRYVFGSEISYNKAPPRLPGLGC
jgi:hypothetical protein